MLQNRRRRLSAAHLSEHRRRSAYYTFPQSAGCEHPQILKNARLQDAIKHMNSKCSQSECEVMSAADAVQMTITRAESFEEKLACCCFFNKNTSAKLEVHEDFILMLAWDDSALICRLVNILLSSSGTHKYAGKYHSRHIMSLKNPVQKQS